MSTYGWIVIFLLLAILAGAIFVAHYGWVLAGDIMPAWGWWMMGLGIFFSLLVGCGLMALIFYSSRDGFDEPPELVPNRHRVHRLVRHLTRRNKSKEKAGSP